MRRPLAVCLIAAAVFGAAPRPAPADFAARTCHIGPTGAEPWALPEATWTLQTTSLRRVTFDTITGRILRAEDAPPWGECGLIVRGQVVRRAGVLEFHPRMAIKGKIAKAVALPVDAGLLENALETVCLARTGDGVRFIRKLGSR